MSSMSSVKLIKQTKRSVKIQHLHWDFDPPPPLSLVLWFSTMSHNERACVWVLRLLRCTPEMSDIWKFWVTVRKSAMERIFRMGFRVGNLDEIFQPRGCLDALIWCHWCHAVNSSVLSKDPLLTANALTSHVETFFLLLSLWNLSRFTWLVKKENYDYNYSNYISKPPISDAVAKGIWTQHLNITYI